MLKYSIDPEVPDELLVQDLDLNLLRRLEGGHEGVDESRALVGQLVVLKANDENVKSLRWIKV